MKKINSNLVKEISLFEIFSILYRFKWLIIGLSILVALFAYSFAKKFQENPLYNASSSFIISNNTLSPFLENEYLQETPKLNSDFLIALINQKNQRDVFIDNGYLELDKPAISEIGDDSINNFLFNEFIKSFSLIKELDANQIGGVEIFKLSMLGKSDPNILLEFLIDLQTLTKEIISENFTQSNLTALNTRLFEISLEEKEIYSDIETKRLLDILALEKSNNLSVLKLKKRISNLREEALIERKNKTIQLEDALKLISSKEIKDEYLEFFNSSSSKNYEYYGIDIAINPIWYFFGKDGIAQRIDSISKRINDDNYINELASLSTKIDDIENDYDLASLKASEYEIPINNQTNNILREKNYILALKKYFLSVDSDSVVNHIILKNEWEDVTKYKNISLITTLGGILGFLLSLLIILILSANRYFKQSTSHH